MAGETAIDPKDWEPKNPGCGDQRHPTLGRASPLGTFAPIADQSDWRQKLKASRIKFDDPAKARYLAELERTGRRGLAARAAGVCNETVARHIKDVDPDFAESVTEAERRYADRICNKIEMEAVEGVLVTKSRIVKADNGEDFEEEVHREVKFETALRGRILAKLDPSYRENSTLNLNNTGGGGVLLIPTLGLAAGFDDWRKLFSPPEEAAQTEDGSTE